MSSPATDSFDLGRARLPPDTVAIVTGAAEGLGRSFVEGLLDKGAKGVCIADVNESVALETLRELSERFGEGRVIFAKCDVTSAAEVEATFAKTKEKYGVINLVVNNAGVANEVDIALTVNVNVTGVAYGSYAAVKYMSPAEGGRGGKVVNMSSIVAFAPHHALKVYVATKFAVLGLTRCFMADPRLKEKGITFGALCPAGVGTRLLNKFVLRQPEEDQEELDKAINHTGLLEIPVVRDALLRLVLDDSWCGRVMAVSSDGGVFDALAH